MLIIKLILLSVLVFSLFYYVFSWYCTARFFRQDNPPLGPTPPVSILKPVRGVEPEIYINFASLCSQAYPSYQLLFGSASRDDPVGEVIEQLRHAYPQTPIHFSSLDGSRVPNEKVAILSGLLREASHDLLVINDADIRVRPDYLRVIVTHLCQPGVGLVTTPYRGIPSGKKTLYSLLTALYINAGFFPALMVAERVSPLDYGLGATLALSRRVLEEVGGFDPLGDLLADDFHLGNRVYRAGYRVRLVPYLVDTLIPPQSLRDYLQQQLRWARTLRSCRPWGYFASIMTHGVTASLLYLVIDRFSSTALLLSVLTLGLRLLTATTLGLKFLRLRGQLYQFLLLPVQDLLNSLFWLLSFLGRGVSWHGRRFLLNRGGKIHLLRP